ADRAAGLCRSGAAAGLSYGRTQRHRHRPAAQFGEECDGGMTGGRVEERNGGLGSIEVKYRLTDLFAINFRAWRSYLKQLVVGELIFVGIIVTISLVSRRGLLAGLHGVHWRFLAMLGSALGFFLIAYWFAACPLIG